jgi:hypothetical protein
MCVLSTGKCATKRFRQGHVLDVTFGFLEQTDLKFCDKNADL